jgi:N-acetylmuramoyl-L-alanine amidase
MPKAINTRNIVIHCSAGFGDKKSIEAFWKSKGWRSPGYHRLVDLNGIVYELADFSKIVNGVLNHNEKTINICYIGGIEKVAGKFKGKDTRTAKQKTAIEYCIQEAKKWLKANGKDITKDLGVVGHRDFSKDSNGNGVIESWERIKECPSFDAIAEYSLKYASKDRIGKIPS